MDEETKIDELNNNDEATQKDLEAEAQANADLLGFIMHDKYTQSSAPQETKTSMEEEVYNLELNRPVPTHKLTRRQRRRDKYREKIRKKYFQDHDIKYRGILSYRYLRLFAWIAIAFSQIVLFHSYSGYAFPSLFKNEVVAKIVTEIADVSLPLFLVASFAYILNRNTSYKSMILFYAFSYFGIAFAEVFVFHRYVINVLVAVGNEQEAMNKLVGLLVGQKIQVNVFSDLFMLILFNFFINYTPKNHFLGKKRIIFRLFAIIPLLIAAGIYVVRIFNVFGVLSLPIYIYPFLTTKSPYIYFIFVVISMWIKNREKLFEKFGASKAEYQDFLRTNRNSWSFSLNISVLFLIFTIIDVITQVISVAILIACGYAEADAYSMIKALGVGQCTGLIAAIPVVLLFSYTRKEKYPQLDTLLPFVGIGLIILVYIEGTYDIVINFLNSWSWLFS